MWKAMKESEFYNIVKQYEKLVFSYCYSFVKDYQEAENLTQETFISFYKALNSFSGTAYKAFLMKIAANKCKDYLKSAYKQRVFMCEDEYFSSLSQGDTTSRELIKKEDYKIIISCIEKLKEPYKSMAKSFYIDEISIDELAGELKLTKKTAQTRLYRARDKLKELLKEELV